MRFIDDISRDENEQEYWEIQAEKIIAEAKAKVVDLAARWHEYEWDHTRTFRSSLSSEQDKARTDLNCACRDLLATGWRPEKSG